MTLFIKIGATSFIWTYCQVFRVQLDMHSFFYLYLILSLDIWTSLLRQSIHLVILAFLCRHNFMFNSVIWTSLLRQFIHLVILACVSYQNIVPSRKCFKVSYLDTMTFPTVLFEHLYLTIDAIGHSCLDLIFEGCTFQKMPSSFFLFRHIDIFNSVIWTSLLRQLMHLVILVWVSYQKAVPSRNHCTQILESKSVSPKQGEDPVPDALVVYRSGKKKKSAPDPFWKKKCQIRFFYLEVRIRMRTLHGSATLWFEYLYYTESEYVRGPIFSPPPSALKTPVLQGR